MRLCLLALVMLGSLSLAEGTAGADAPADLLFFQREVHQLTFSVVSNGCTRADDFRLVLTTETSGTAATMLTIVRTKRDRCRMRPHQKTIVVPLTDHFVQTSSDEKNGLRPEMGVLVDELVISDKDRRDLLRSKVLLRNPFITLAPIRRQ